MRILIDLQACQSTGSRNRGIGRYSLALAKAMAKRSAQHELHFALNGLFPETIPVIRNEFADLLPRQHIHTWNSIPSVFDVNPDNSWRRRAAELVREHAISQLRPDMVHVSSLFEGLMDDAIVDVRSSSRSLTAVTLYDLIPLIHSKHYLNDEKVSAWYFRKLQALKNADLLLAISNSSMLEALEWLQLPDQNVINISSAVDDRFVVTSYSQETMQEVLSRHGLRPQFVMYTGGIDLRKNIDSLISSYAKLPVNLRKAHQLAIVCSVHEDEKKRLLNLAKKEGLLDGDVVMTGFVSDEDLPVLYHACRLFVFPSWHEGFGLPALEAMACGAPVIAANTSSLPEVIGREDALFDPFKQSAITEKMQQALSDDNFSESLRQHGVQQSKKFSWDESARRTWEGFEATYERQQHAQKTQVANVSVAKKPKLAFVSPLPPERSGIADYSASLLPELARYYDIDLISDQPSLSNRWLAANFALRSVAWFEGNAHKFDRIMYHFGNSPFHGHMFDLLKRYPGVVVLHDFYLSNIVSHLDYIGKTSGGWVDSLYASHGYSALLENKANPDIHQVIWKYPTSLPVLHNATGVILHSNYSIGLAKKWFGVAYANKSNFIPLLKGLPSKFDREAVRSTLGFKNGDFLICAFGLLGPTKLNHRLLQAWIASRLAENPNCYLVFVGQNDGAQYGANLLEQIKRSGFASRIRITGFAEEEEFRRYLMGADAAVQLRTMSRGETSLTVLDCMAHGVPTIVNANGAMAELPEQALIRLDDDFADQELTDAILRLYGDAQLRTDLGLRGIDHIKAKHHPYAVGIEYAKAIEANYAESAYLHARPLLKKIAEIDTVQRPSNEELLSLSQSIASNSLSYHGKRLLVDVSTLAQVDAKSGIQRVVRAILAALISEPLFGGRVEPVILTEHGLKYARTFTCKQFELPQLSSGDDLVEVSVNDIFLGLDLNCGPVVHYHHVLQRMKTQGVQIFFVVYDILPVVTPHFFEKNLSEIFLKWIQTVVQYGDGAICISRAVEAELKTWIDQHDKKRSDQFLLSSFHLGADLEASLPEKLDVKLEPMLQSALDHQVCFLMVGTVEPRKGHEYALNAFEALWKTGHDIALIIVGGQGWKTEALIKRIEQHPENKKRLFWLRGIDDDTLQDLYVRSKCLLMTSWGEGFGLPLIEAARFKLPIIARKLPVFEEIGGEHVFYFDGLDSSVLVDRIEQWLRLYSERQIPDSGKIEWLTWKDSAEQLCIALDNLIKT